MILKLFKKQHIFWLLLWAFAAYSLSISPKTYFLYGGLFTASVKCVDKCLCDMLQSKYKGIISTRLTAWFLSKINQYFTFFVVFLVYNPHIWTAQNSSLYYKCKHHITLWSNNVILWGYPDIMSLKWSCWLSKPQTSNKRSFFICTQHSDDTFIGLERDGGISHGQCLQWQSLDVLMGNMKK